MHAGDYKGTSAPGAEEQFKAQAGFSLGEGWPKGLDYPEKGYGQVAGGPPSRPSRSVLDDYKLAGNSQILGECFAPVDTYNPDAYASAEESIWLPLMEK